MPINSVVINNMSCVNVVLNSFETETMHSLGRIPYDKHGDFPFRKNI